MSVTLRMLTWIGLRHSPLSRRIDRIEARSRLALLLVFLIAALPISWYVGEAVNRAGVAQELAQRSGRHQVSARLLEDAPAAVTSTVAIRIPIAAEWTELDGSHHSGMIRAVPGSPAGSIHTIWTDAAGNPVPAPLGHDDTVASVAGAVLLIFTLIGNLLLGIGVLIHRRFDRQRMEQWASEWQEVGPAWSRHG